MRKIDVIFQDFQIDTVPMEKVIFEEGKFCVYLDDVNEKRHKVVFSPYQAIKITAIDCMSAQEFYNEYCYRDGIYHRHILKIENSDWISELNRNFKDADPRSNFMFKSNHYVLPLYEEIIEVVAWDIELIKVNNET